MTGIAGPGGAVPGKPVGTVWLGWAARRGRAIRVAVQLRHFRGDRDAVRRKTVRAALQGLLTRCRAGLETACGYSLRCGLTPACAQRLRTPPRRCPRISVGAASRRRTII